MRKHKTSAKSWNTFVAEVNEAKKDPEFMKELRKFIKVTTS